MVVEMQWKVVTRLKSREGIEEKEGLVFQDRKIVRDDLSLYNCGVTA